MLNLVEAFLKAGILNGLEETEPEMGAPRGAVLSPLLSNIYLNPLDHLMVSRGFEMVRYADDFVILCRSCKKAEQALAIVRQWCEAEGLTVHPTKTRVVHVRKEGFDFLGYQFQATQRGRLTRWPREKRLMKLRDTIRAKTNLRPYRAGVLWGPPTQGGASLYPGLSHSAPLGLRKGWICPLLVGRRHGADYPCMVPIGMVARE